MKNLLWWIAGGALVYFLFTKYQPRAAAAKKTAAAGITNNPITAAGGIWDTFTQLGKQQSAANIDNALSSAQSILTGLGAHFGGTSPASGKVSPTNSGSGAGGPTQGQINRVQTDPTDNGADDSTGMADDSTDFAGDELG